MALGWEGFRTLPHPAKSCGGRQRGRAPFVLLPFHPAPFPLAELRRFHLCLFCRGNDSQDDRAGDFREEMLPGRHLEPPGLLHRHRGVSQAPRLPPARVGFVAHVPGLGKGSSGWRVLRSRGLLCIRAVSTTYPRSLQSFRLDDTIKIIESNR